MLVTFFSFHWSFLLRLSYHSNLYWNKYLPTKVVLSPHFPFNFINIWFNLIAPMTMLHTNLSIRIGQIILTLVLQCLKVLVQFLFEHAANSSERVCFVSSAFYLYLCSWSVISALCPLMFQSSSSLFLIISNLNYWGQSCM